MSREINISKVNRFLGVGRERDYKLKDFFQFFFVF